MVKAAFIALSLTLALPIAGFAMPRCDELFAAGSYVNSGVRTNQAYDDPSIESARGLLGPTTELLDTTSRLVKQIADAQAGSRLNKTTLELHEDMVRIARYDVSSRTRLGRVLNLLTRREGKSEEWATRFRKNHAELPALLAEVKSEGVMLRAQADDIRSSFPRLAEQAAKLEEMVVLLNRELARRSQTDPVRQTIDAETLPSVIHALAELKTLEALASASLEAIAERLTTDQALLDEAVKLNDEALPALLVSSGPKLKRLLANESLEFCVHGGLCVGMDVVAGDYGNYRRGRVKGVYSDGRVELEFGVKDKIKMMGRIGQKSHRIYLSHNVAVADPRYSAQGFRVGEKVRVIRSGIETTVMGFFLSGNIALDFGSVSGTLASVRPEQITSLDRPVSREQATLFEQVSGNERLSQIARFLRSATLPELSVVNSPAAELLQHGKTLELSVIMLSDAALSGRALREVGRDKKPRPTALFEEIIDGITDNAARAQHLIHQTIADREHSRRLLIEVEEYMRAAEAESSHSPHAVSLKTMLEAVRIALEQRIRIAEAALEKTGPEKVASINGVLKFHEAELKEKLGPALFDRIFPQGIENGPIPNVARKHFANAYREPVVVKRDSSRESAFVDRIEKYDKETNRYTLDDNPTRYHRYDLAVMNEGITFMGVAVGDRVLISGQTEGRVMGLFPDGRFAIGRPDGYAISYFLPATELTVIRERAEERP